MHLTSLAVNGLPSCHLTPSRSLKVSVLPSSLQFQLVARSGTIDRRGCSAACSDRYMTRLFMTPMVGINGRKRRLLVDRHARRAVAVIHAQHAAFLLRQTRRRQPKSIAAAAANAFQFLAENTHPHVSRRGCPELALTPARVNLHSATHFAAFGSTLRVFYQRLDGRSRMKAVLCREWGGPDSLRFEEVAARPLKPHEVRIRVRACGVNFADTLMVAGNYQVKPPVPVHPRPRSRRRDRRDRQRGRPSRGRAAGARGAAQRRRLCRGDRAQRRRGGADPRRDGFRHRRRLSGRLRHLAFRADPSRPSARPGETLLVLGAAGGVGLTAVEIGKRWARGSSPRRAVPRKLAVAREHGADELIDYQQREHPRPGARADRRARAPMSSTTRSAATRSTRRCARSTGRRGCWSSALPPAASRRSRPI